MSNKAPLLITILEENATRNTALTSTWHLLKLLVSSAHSVVKSTESQRKFNIQFAEFCRSVLLTRKAWEDAVVNSTYATTFDVNKELSASNVEAANNIGRLKNNNNIYDNLGNKINNNNNRKSNENTRDGNVLDNTNTDRHAETFSPVGNDTNNNVIQDNIEHKEWEATLPPQLTAEASSFTFNTTTTNTTTTSSSSNNQETERMKQFKYYIDHGISETALLKEIAAYVASSTPTLGRRYVEHIAFGVLNKSKHNQRLEQQEEYSEESLLLSSSSSSSRVKENNTHSRNRKNVLQPTNIATKASSLPLEKEKEQSQSSSPLSSSLFVTLPPPLRDSSYVKSHVASNKTDDIHHKPSQPQRRERCMDKYANKETITNTDIIRNGNNDNDDDDDDAEINFRPAKQRTLERTNIARSDEASHNRIASHLTNICNSSTTLYQANLSSSSLPPFASDQLGELDEEVTNRMALGIVLEEAKRAANVDNHANSKLSSFSSLPQQRKSENGAPATTILESCWIDTNSNNSSKNKHITRDYTEEGLFISHKVMENNKRSNNYHSNSSKSVYGKEHHHASNSAHVVYDLRDPALKLSAIPELAYRVQPWTASASSLVGVTLDRVVLDKVERRAKLFATTTTAGAAAVTSSFVRGNAHASTNVNTNINNNNKNKEQTYKQKEVREGEQFMEENEPKGESSRDKHAECKEFTVKEHEYKSIDSESTDVATLYDICAIQHPTELLHAWERREGARAKLLTNLSNSRNNTEHNMYDNNKDINHEKINNNSSNSNNSNNNNYDNVNINVEERRRSDISDNNNITNNSKKEVTVTNKENAEKELEQSSVIAPTKREILRKDNATSEMLPTNALFLSSEVKENVSIPASLMTNHIHYGLSHLEWAYAKRVKKKAS